MEVILRPWETGDAPALALGADNPKIGVNLRDGFPSPYTVADAQAFICAARQEEGTAMYARAVVANGIVAGSIALYPGSNVYRKSAELAYFLSEPFWGRGIMTQAVRQLCAASFEQYGMERIFAEPYAANAASRRVLEQAGFLLEGVLREHVYKNGVLQDSCIYALLRRDWARQAPGDKE